MTQPRRILRQPAAAKYVGLAESTLEKYRLTGGGPRFVRLGVRAIGYDVQDLDAWIDAQKRSSTSDGGGLRRKGALKRLVLERARH
jgi:predicted DNA-binding transcriptional regulator AlpA